MYWIDLREPSGSFFNPCSSSRHKPEVHTNDLDRTVCALVQIVRILSEADYVTTERLMLDTEVETLASHMIQDLICNLNRKTMSVTLGPGKTQDHNPSQGRKTMTVTTVMTKTRSTKPVRV